MPIFLKSDIIEISFAYGRNEISDFIINVNRKIEIVVILFL